MNDQKGKIWQYSLVLVCFGLTGVRAFKLQGLTGREVCRARCQVMMGMQWLCGRRENRLRVLDALVLPYHHDSWI